MAFVSGAGVGGRQLSLAKSARGRMYAQSHVVRMAKGVDFESMDGSELRVGIVHAKWGKEMISQLVKDAKSSLRECKVKDENIVEVEVPGSFELPIAARFMAMTQKVDAVICCGVLIKGETDHYEYIAQAVSSGLMSLQLQTGIPMIFGVLTCPEESHALARSTGDKSHAKEWGMTAIQMGLFRKSQIVTPKEKKVGFA